MTAGGKGAGMGAHLVVYVFEHELVCSCGAVLSNFGLTRSLASILGEHIRTARAEQQAHSGGGES